MLKAPAVMPCFAMTTSYASLCKGVIQMQLLKPAFKSKPRVKDFSSPADLAESTFELQVVAQVMQQLRLKISETSVC